EGGSMNHSITAEEGAAFARLLQHVGFAPTITLGKGSNAKALKRLVDEQDVVYAVTTQSGGREYRDGTQRFELWVTPIAGNGLESPRRTLRGSNGGQPSEAWTPAMRRAAAARAKKIWETRRANAAARLNAGA